MAADEAVEVIGPDGSVQRIVTRAEMQAGRLRHRCTFVVVRSSAGDVLVHRRSETRTCGPAGGISAPVAW